MMGQDELYKYVVEVPTPNSSTFNHCVRNLRQSLGCGRRTTTALFIFNGCKYASFTIFFKRNVRYTLKCAFPDVTILTMKITVKFGKSLLNLVNFSVTSVNVDLEMHVAS